MTKYDMKCKSCDHEWFFESTMKDYSALRDDSKEWECPQCSNQNGKNQRILSNKIGKIVHGVSKGYYGRG